MISHNHPRFDDPDFNPFPMPTDDSPDKCVMCGDEEYEMRDTSKGFLCSSCTRTCTICGDWMMTEVGVMDNEGNEAHKDCAEEWKAGGWRNE